MIKMGNDIHLSFVIPQTELLAGTPIELVSPVDGFVNELFLVVQTTVTVGGAVTVKAGTEDIAGLSITVPNTSAKGTTFRDVEDKPNLARKVAKGQRIQIVPSAAFDTAGALSGVVRINTGH